MVKGTPSRQVAQAPWARSRSTLAGSGAKAAKDQRPSTWHTASPSELRKALRLFVQLDETQSHWIPFDLYIITTHFDIALTYHFLFLTVFSSIWLIMVLPFGFSTALSSEESFP